MATYKVTGPDGRTHTITGDKPPTAEELDAIFAAIPELTPEQKAKNLRESKPESGFDWDPSKESREDYAARSAMQMDRELYAQSLQGRTERAILPRGFEQRQRGEKPTLGATALDFMSLPGRTTAGLVDEVAASIAPEGSIGSEIPFFDAMLGSMGDTEGEGWVEMPESVIRDPSTLIPGLNVAKLGWKSRVPLKAAYEGAIEAGSQYLDPTREYDLGSIMLGAGLPVVGEGAKGIGKAAAESRFGEKGGELLEEGLVPFLGDPSASISKKLDPLLETRAGAAKDLSRESLENLPAPDYTSISLKTQGQLAKKLSDGEIRKDQYDKAISMLNGEITQLKKAGTSLLPLSNRTKSWAKEMNMDNERGLVSRLLYDNSKNPLSKLDFEGKDELVNLQDLQNFKESPIQGGSIGEIVKSQPLMKSLYEAGGLLERGGSYGATPIRGSERAGLEGSGSYGLSPEAMKALYGQVMSEE